MYDTFFSTIALLSYRENKQRNLKIPIKYKKFQNITASSLASATARGLEAYFEMEIQISFVCI